MGRPAGLVVGILAPWCFVACPAEHLKVGVMQVGAGGEALASQAGETSAPIVATGGAPAIGGARQMSGAGQAGDAGQTGGTGQGGYEGDGCPGNLCGDGDLAAGDSCRREGTLCGSCENDCPMLLCENGTWLGLYGQDRGCPGGDGGGGGAGDAP